MERKVVHIKYIFFSVYLSSGVSDHQNSYNTPLIITDRHKNFEDWMLLSRDIKKRKYETPPFFPTPLIHEHYKTENSKFLSVI